MACIHPRSEHPPRVDTPTPPGGYSAAKRRVVHCSVSSRAEAQLLPVPDIAEDSLGRWQPPERVCPDSYSRSRWFS
jgi:hypothetical protein